MKKKPKKLTDVQLKKKIKKAVDTGKIELAPTKKLDKVYAMAYDFVEHCVLRSTESGCLITDWSYISDFGMWNNKKEEAALIKKTIKIAQARYRIDITSVINKSIVDIAEFMLGKCTNEFI